MPPLIHSTQIAKRLLQRIHCECDRNAVKSKLVCIRHENLRLEKSANLNNDHRHHANDSQMKMRVCAHLSIHRSCNKKVHTSTCVYAFGSWIWHTIPLHTSAQTTGREKTFRYFASLTLSAMSVVAIYIYNCQREDIYSNAKPS